MDRALGIPLSLRFLVIPGHLDCCLRPLLERAAREAPGVPVTLLTGYMPPVACPEAPELLRLLAPEEVERAARLSLDPSRLGRPHPRGRHDITVAPAIASSNATRETSSLELFFDADGRICFSTVGSVAIELTARAFGRREDDPS